MRKLLLMLCVVLIASCSSFRKAYFETKVNYSVISNGDTLNILRTDTIPSFVENSFIAYLSPDSSCIFINSAQSNGEITEMHHRENRKFDYPNCKIIINDFQYRKIREFNASRWDGREI